MQISTLHLGQLGGFVLRSVDALSYITESSGVIHTYSKSGSGEGCSKDFYLTFPIIIITRKIQSPRIQYTLSASFTQRQMFVPSCIIGFLGWCNKPIHEVWTLNHKKTIDLFRNPL